MVSIRGDRLEALWVCAISLRLRRGALLGLPWVDIDQTAQTVSVRRRCSGRMAGSCSRNSRLIGPFGQSRPRPLFWSTCGSIALASWPSGCALVNTGRIPAWYPHPRSGLRWTISR